MTTVTKVFLVLLVIGAIALSTAAITITAQTVRWRDLAEQYQANSLAVAAESANVSAQAQVIQEQQNSTIQSLTQQLQAAQAALAERQNEVAELQAAVQRYQVESAADKATLVRVTRSLEVEQGRANQLQEQTQQLLARGLDLEKRNIDLSDRVRELMANVQVLESETRTLQQRNYALQEQLANLREQMALGPQQPGAVGVQPSPGVQPLSPMAASPIRGKILEVDGNVLGISVGSADGVKPGQVFVVYRGDQSLGRLVIRDVDPRVAAGILDQRFGDIQVGDMVINEAGLPLAQQ